jgi:hypothetical protein
MCGKREWRLGCEDEEQCKEVAKTNMSYNMHCVLEWMNKSKVVPQIHFVALLKLEAPARTISVESTLALNPWCFGARVVYVLTPGTHPLQSKAIHDSLSVLPKLETSKKLRVIHSTWQLITPPHELVPLSSKCLTFPSPSQGHSAT